MNKQQQSIIKLSMAFAHAVLPDEETPMDLRSVFPPGTVSMDVEYKAAQICAAVWFQEGFEYAMHNPDKTPDEYRQHIEAVAKDENPKLKQRRFEAFSAGVSCFQLGEIKIEQKDKVVTIKIEKE